MRTIILLTCSVILFFSCKKDTAIAPEFSGIKIYDFTFSNGVNFSNTPLVETQGGDYLWSYWSDGKFRTRKIGSDFEVGTEYEYPLNSLMGSIYWGSSFNPKLRENHTNENFILAGIERTNLGTTGYDNSYLCLNEFNGNGVISHKDSLYIGEYYYMYPYNPTIVEDGGFYYSAYEMRTTDISNVTSDSIIIWKLDANFDEVARVSFPVTYAYYGTFDMEVSNNKVWLLYYDYYSGYFIKSYDINLQNPISTPYANVFAGYAGTKGSTHWIKQDNSVLLSGYLYQTSISQVGYLRLDNTHFVNQYSNASLSQNNSKIQQYYGMSECSDGGHLFFFREAADLNLNPSNNIGVSKIDVNGNEVVRFSFSAGVAGFIPAYVKENADQTFTVFGNKLVEGTNNVMQGFATRLDANGNFVR